MKINVLLLLFCILFGCSNNTIETTCQLYKPTLNQPLITYDSITPKIQVFVNDKLWKNWGNGPQFTSIDNPIFIQVRPNIRYQICKGNSCGQEVCELNFIKSQGVSLSESSHLESFQFKINLADTIVTKLRLSKRGQYLYTTENILENDQVCQFKQEIIGVLLEDDEYYGKYRLDSTKVNSFKITELNPEQQIMSIEFNGNFIYDRTNVDTGFLSKVDSLYQPSINVKIISRFRYKRLNEN